jgi:hypothetical protein
MSEHPYKHLPDHAFWRRAVAAVAPEDINPAVGMPFSIAPQDRVVTAGSCFAQHIGPNLTRHGFTYFVTEPAHPLFADEAAARYGYGMFSARYGNIYTARQLLQLFERAQGRFTPAEDEWSAGPWRVDPFRPQIQPHGFMTAQEYALDRAQHFAAVRRAFAELDVFVFTLGLTEAWRARADGAVFPLCPGVAGGVFDPARHEFHNFTVAEVVADLIAFTDALRSVNPRARIVLTVSPVPLVATARAGTHVLSATTYSKSVLRVAAEMAAAARPGLAYFPAYEIVTTGGYFAADRRSVTPQGVAHVMRAFFAAFAYGAAEVARPVVAADGYMARVEEAMRVHCDEIALDPG